MRDEIIDAEYVDVPERPFARRHAYPPGARGGAHAPGFVEACGLSPAEKPSAPLVVEIAPGIARRRVRRLALVVAAGIFLGVAPWVAREALEARQYQRTNELDVPEEKLIDAALRGVNVDFYNARRPEHEALQVESLLSDPEARRLGAMCEASAEAGIRGDLQHALADAQKDDPDVTWLDQLAPEAYRSLVTRVDLPKLRDVRARLDKGPGQTYVVTIVGRRVVENAAGMVESDAPIAFRVYLVRVPADDWAPDGVMPLATEPVALPADFGKEVGR